MLNNINKNGNVLRNQSVNFYRKCVENKLSTDEFQFKRDGTTQLKLEALPTLLDITKITKIAGDYNKSRPYLLVDKLIGGVNFCLWLSQEDNVYVPSSALLEDIKKLTDALSQVLAILEKDFDTEIYFTVKHVAKEVNFKEVNLPQDITSMINLDNYVYKGK